MDYFVFTLGIILLAATIIMPLVCLYLILTGAAFQTQVLLLLWTILVYTISGHLGRNA